MPFTVAHTVAVIPLLKYLGRFGALSALIIGSMIPDFSYLTPYLVDQRMDSHSLLAIYLYAIPMGLTVYFIYHLLMAPVIVSILPKGMQQYLHPHLFLGRLPNIPTYTLIFSLVLGALTHISWDFFTHQTGIPQYIGWMSTPLTSIDGYDIMPYRVLQHSSSLLGLSLLSFWIWAWYSKKNKATVSIPLKKKWEAPSYLRYFSLITLLTLPIIIGISSGLMNIPDTDILHKLYSKQVFVRFAILAWAKAFILTTSFLGLLYQYQIYKRQ